jgi:hypothetical protein
MLDVFLIYITVKRKQLIQNNFYFRNIFDSIKQSTIHLFLNYWSNFLIT